MKGNVTRSRCCHSDENSIKLFLDSPGRLFKSSANHSTPKGREFDGTYAPEQQLPRANLSSTARTSVDLPTSRSPPSSCTEQHPLHSVPHPHVSPGQPHLPAQHSSFGRRTSPNAGPRSSSRARSPANRLVGYVVTFIGSNALAEDDARRGGGGGSAAAARARNASMKLAPAEPSAKGSAAKGTLAEP